MLKKISLSVMTFTYLFAGIVHFLRFDYFLSITPSFIPYPRVGVLVTGLLQLLFALLLPFGRTRRGACFGIILFWSLALPLNVYVLSRDGAGIPLASWQIAGMIPFHLLLMFWAFWHSQKDAGSPLGADSRAEKGF